MRKNLQDLAWSCLPREFREEVKKEYQKGYVCETLAMLITLFGHHNLTSDAEGEEMLTVKRSDVIREFDKLHKYSYQSSDLQLGLNALKTLFGSKCLPDEAKDDAKDNKQSNVDSLESKPSALKYQIGQTVRHRWSGEIHKIIEWCPGDHLPYRLDSGIWTKESDLEPATESDLNTSPTACIDLDGRRLRIAAQMVPHVIGTVTLADTDKGYCKAVAVRARMLADAIIAECMKGGVE